MMRCIVVLLVTVLLSACAGSNVTYRGVSPQIWQKLTSEQKQIIIDKSYEKTMNQQIGS